MAVGASPGAALRWALPFGAFTFVFRLLSVGKPAWGDEGSYMAVASQGVSGLRIYADTQSHRPPLLYLWYSIAHSTSDAIGVHSFILVRVAAAVSAFVAVASIAYLLKRHTAFAFPGAMCIALLLCAVNTHTLDANAESLMIGAYALSGVLVGEVLLGGSRLSVRAAMMAGAVFGIAALAAALTKQVGAVLLGLPVVAMMLDGEYRRRWFAFSAAALGGAAALGVAVAAWAWSSGQLPEMIVFAGVANLFYVGSRLRSGPAANFMDAMVLLWAWPLIVAGVSAVLTAYASIRVPSGRSRKLALFALGWTTLSLVGVAASGRFYPHYFVQLIPPLSLLFGASLDLALHAAETESPRAGRRPATTVAVLAALVLVPLAVGVAAGPFYPITDPARKATSARDIADMLRRSTTEDDLVFVWGARNEILAYADRLPSARVRECWTSFALDLFGESEGRSFLGVALENPGTRILAQWNSGDLPDAVVLAMGFDDAGGLDPPDCPEVPARLSAMLEERYERVGGTGDDETGGYMELYVLRDR